MKPKEGQSLGTSLDDGKISGILASFGRLPVTRLVEQIALTGPSWFTSTLEEQVRPHSLRAILGGRLEEADWKALKARAKALHARGGDDVLTGFVCYFTAIAGGLQHLDRILSGQSHDKIRESLLDLSSVLEGEWADFFREAGRRIAD